MALEVSSIFAILESCIAKPHTGQAGRHSKSKELCSGLLRLAMCVECGGHRHRRILRLCMTLLVTPLYSAHSAAQVGTEAAALLPAAVPWSNRNIIKYSLHGGFVIKQGATAKLGSKFLFGTADSLYLVRFVAVCLSTGVETHNYEQVVLILS